MIHRMQDGHWRVRFGLYTCRLHAGERARSRAPSAAYAPECSQNCAVQNYVLGS